MSRNREEQHVVIDPSLPEKNLLAASIWRLKKDLNDRDPEVRQAAADDLRSPPREWVDALESAGLTGILKRVQRAFREAERIEK